MSYSRRWKGLAKGLLGSAPRAAVAAYFAGIGDDEWVRQEDVRRGTGLLQGQVNKATRELAALGLLEERRPEPIGWPYYKRVRSELWKGMRTVCSAIAVLTGDGNGSSSDGQAAAG